MAYPELASQTVAAELRRGARYPPFGAAVDVA
jgi:hypothetical protein